ncbi:MBL fold metallo-hydrolase [Nocardioides flavescens]|uniref:MBL fold metallo-hydrolase n=1 Tax=Nocardioides flavescens TaxID=2691959 RepID=A0A6L7EWA5_9ACTN|nr:MBL fold metallo-hydrolase [Nocardioides flavescens]
MTGDRGEHTLTFGGTAMTLLRLGSFTLLTDPNFLHRGQRAYLGKGLWSRRLTEPALQAADLPPLDAIVLSHLHGDHFDRIARRDLARDQPVVTTPAAARRLSRWGFETRGLRTWETETLTRGDETLSIEALPAFHARGAMRALLPPVMGSLLEHRVGGEVRLRVYVTGDTLTGDHVDLIAERHPDLDVAVVHLGGTRVLFHTVTMDATQGVDLLDRVRPGSVVPVHFDDYRVFRSPRSAFLEAAARAGLPSVVRPVERGETLTLARRP